MTTGAILMLVFGVIFLGGGLLYSLGKMDEK